MEANKERNTPLPSHLKTVTQNRSFISDAVVTLFFHMALNACKCFSNIL